MQRLIQEAIENGDERGLRTALLAVVAENDALHRTIREQSETLDRLIASVRATTEVQG